MNEETEKDIFIQFEQAIQAAQKNTVYPKIYKGKTGEVKITAIYRDLTKKEELIKMIAVVKDEEFRLPNVKIIRSNNA